MPDPEHDEVVSRFLAARAERDEVRARAGVSLDMKMTFFSPDAHPDNLGNVCPICLRRTPTSAREADYICESCADRAVDEGGRAVVFCNIDLAGGVMCRYRDTREERKDLRCFIDGRPCVGDEARFGGIVHRLHGEGGLGKKHPSRDGNRVAERVAGAVLGAAIGDALGHPTEFVRSYEDLYRRFGPRGVEGFVLFREADGKRFAPYTDDTQLAEVVLRGLLDALDGGEDLARAMARLARGVIEWARAPQGGHRGPGRSCLAGAKALESGAPWARAGAPDAGGCGSVMRAYPVGLVFHSDPSLRETYAVAQSRLTHNAPIALAASSAMAHATASVIRGDGVERTLKILVDSAALHDIGTATMIADAARAARSGEAKESVLMRLQGWAAHEAIAAATYVYLRHPDDFPAAVLEAANSPGDSDSIATLVGALVGGRCGLNAIPAEWVRDLERSDELAALARRTLATSVYPDWDALLAALQAIDTKHGV